MKTIPLLTICIILSAGYVDDLKADPNCRRMIDPDSLVLINAEINFYRCGDFYFGGWPPVEALEWLNSEGVKTVINLRSEQEMEQFASGMFNEDSLVQSLGMTYRSLPMPGQAGFNPETLESFTTILEETKGKVFIHCYGCYRVTYLVMAWMIKTQGFSIDEAVEFGRKMKYFSPLDGLLGKELRLVEDM
jgi:protein tyrosine phosphatase (PTP) superfamily phosphohydrolase (DUF442 family)